MSTDSNGDQASRPAHSLTPATRSRGLDVASAVVSAEEASLPVNKEPGMARTRLAASNLNVARAAYSEAEKDNHDDKLLDGAGPSDVGDVSSEGRSEGRISKKKHKRKRSSDRLQLGPSLGRPGERTLRYESQARSL